MSTPPVHRPRARRSSGVRRFAALGVAGVALVLAAVACQQSPSVGVTNTGPTVLGVYEFEFGGLSSGDVRATVRRLDDAMGVERSALEPTPLGGISLASSVAGGVETCGDYDYIHSVFNLETTGLQENVTFVAYASQGFSLEGTAFAEVADALENRIAGAATIAPSIGGPVDCVAGVPALTNPQDLATVIYSDTEIGSVETTLKADYGFVEAVFPYGFVASNGADRTLTVADGGQLRLGFRVPAGVELVRWRAVALADNAYRLALPYEFNERDVGGTDNLAEFLGQVGRISQANQGVDGVNPDVEAVVLGDGVRALVSIDADDWIDGTNTLDLSILDLIVVPDVRLAGPSAAATSYWIGDGVGGANVGTTPFGQFAVEFKTPGTSYSFLPPADVSLDVAAIGGGGAGGGRTQNGAGGGGGGGAFAGDTVANATGTYLVSVGAGGQATTGTGTAGGASTFDTIVSAVGGDGGGGGNANTPGAGGTGSTDGTTFDGGTGAAGGAVGAVGTVGAGGGAAGTTGNGGNADGAEGGTGTVLYGGNGAAGPAAVGNAGLPGFVFGGGGGAGARQGTDVIGGAGAPGIVVVTYAVP